MPSPLTDELTDEAKAELAAIFAALKTQYPPVQYYRASGHVHMLPMQRRRYW